MSAVTQGPSAAAGALTGLARALVQQGRLRPDRAEALARKATQSNTLFVDELVGIGETIGLSPTAIARFAAETFGHPLFDLSAIDADQLPKDTIDRKLVASLRVLARSPAITYIGPRSSSVPASRCDGVWGAPA